MIFKDHRMRIKLHLRPTSKSKILPINYQYELAAWLFGVIESVNPDYAEFLHNVGYSNIGDTHNYKFFTFSNFYIPQKQIQGDRIIIQSPKLQFQLSFIMDETASSIITGILEDASFVIADHKSGVDFKVERIERMYEPEFTDTMQFRSLSPICVSRPTEAQAEFLGPEHPNYNQYFFNHLVKKYQVLVPDFIPKVKTDIKVLNKPSSKLVAIRATSTPLYIRGYFFDFQITADPELTQFSYFAGFGEKNSMGFGLVVEKK